MSEQKGTIVPGPQALPAAALKMPASERSPVRVLASLPGNIGNAFKRSMGGLGGGSWLESGVSSSLLRGIGASSDSERIRQPYKQEPWVFACVDLFAIVSSAVPLRLYDRDPVDPRAELLPMGHPVRRFFENVNDLLDPSMAAICDAQNVSLTGETLWFMRGRDGGPIMPVPADDPMGFIDLPEDYWPIRGDLVNPVSANGTSGGGPIVGWEVPVGNGGRKIWPVGSVLHFYERPDPDRPGRGLGRLAGAFGPVAQNHLARRYQNVLLQNIGDPGGIVVVGDFLSDAEYERASAQVSEEWGPENAGETKLLEGDAKYVSGKTNPREMEYRSLLEANKGDISAVFQTAPGLLGADVENYATFEGRFRSYLFLRVAPWFRLQASKLNSSFFPRLRRPEWQGIRAAYDTRELNQAIGDIGSLAAAVRTLTNSGVPLNAAIELAGLKTQDPIPGGDSGFVSASSMPVEMALLHGRAKVAKEIAMAAKIAAEAGLDLGSLFQVSGFEQIPMVLPPDEPEPEKEPEKPKASEDEEEEESKFATGGIVRHSFQDCAIRGDVLVPLPQKGATDTPEEVERKAKAKKASRIAAWRSFQQLQAANRRKLDRKLKRTFFEMRTAQLRAFAEYAETGAVSRSSAFAKAEPASLRALLMDGGDGFGPVSGPTVGRMSKAEKASLVEAYVQDLAEEARIRKVRPERLKRTLRSCGGRPCGTKSVVWRPNVSRWIERHPRFKAAGLEAIEDSALYIRAEITPADIEELLLVQDEKWAEALAKSLEPITLDAFRRAAEEVAEELGVEVLNVTSPDVLRAFADKAIEVAEGTQSVVAQRLRRDVLRVLSENTTVGTLQERVKASLKELNASTTKAFNSHSARALAIARTEIGGASNSARFEQLRAAFEEGTISSIEWFTSGRGPEPGGTVRASHHSQDGVQRTPGEAFPNGLLHPLQSGAPPKEVVNCECGIRGIVPEDDED